MEIDVQEACHQLSEVKLENRNESKSESVSEHVEKTPSSDIDEEEVNRIQIKYNRLVSKAKQLTGEGQIRAALELNQRALKLHHNEKLAKRIAKMEAYLKEHGDESSDEDSGMVHVGKGFYLYKDFFDKLYAHQREGVSWLWGLYRQKKGGILGDDMGLGKTIQIIAFLSGLFDMQKVHAALLVMPVSVMVNWEKEFKKWAPGIRVNLYHGNSKREKERSLAKIQRRGGVCITSYGLVVTSWKLLSEQDGREFRWDYLILDEGHKIKNPTKTTKGVQAIGARNRLILTGTPVQNNLKELWALFDFVHQGTLLGTARTFKMEFENPITRARERDATAGERRLGMEMAEGLKNIIAPYFLRRTKAEVKEKEARQGTDEKDSAVKMPSMTRKNDLIVWLFLTPTQQQIYEDFLSLDSVKELLMTTKSPLVALTVLKKICDHPRLLSTRACAQLGLDGEDGMDESELDTPEAHQCAANQINQIEDEVLIKESGKLIVLVELLDNLKMEGHRCLVFSQSRKILDIIAKIVKNRGHKVMRLDGTVTSIEERDQRIKKFQSDDSYSVFLLTTQVGGVGLTLTAADRVIIFDPSWNPATDEQAVDRVFRIGQDKNVVIYRLITCGTVEEKIYRRQIFKDSITRQTTGSTKNPYRYFTKQELRELFTLDSPRCSTTQQQLEEMHSSNRKTDQSLDAHIAFLYSLDIFGISDHDLMFTQDHSDQNRDDEMDDDTSELEGNDYIQHRVQKARELIQMESSVSTTFNLQEQVKAPRIGEPRQQNWAGPQVNFPKTEEPEFKEEPTEDQGDLSTSCVDLTSPDNSIHDSSPTASEQASNNSVISVSESPSKDENSKSDLNSVKIEALTPDVTRIKSEIESPENKNNSLHEDGKETVSPSLNPQIKKEKDSPKVLDKGDMETRLPVLSLVKKELESPSAVTHQSPKLLDNQSPQVSNCLSPKMLDYHSFEENKENMSPVLYRAKQLNSPSVRNQKESGETNEFQTPSRREKRKSVSKSPWLARTPKLENRKVIEEEIFISPDATRPLVKTEPKLNFKSPLAVKNFSRLNSTLMSAFSSDSPGVCDKSVSSTGSSVGDSPPQSKLGMTFVGESPESKQDPLYTTFVGDSPNMVNKLRDKSRIGNLSNVLKVVDSTQNTPISLSAQSSIHGEKSANMEEVCVVESTDDESSPQKSFTDSPIHTVKNRHKVRKAVIESSDEEYGIKSDDESPSVDAIKNSDSESEDKCGHSNKFSDKENEKSVSESDKQEVCESDNDTEEDKNDIHVNKKKKSVIASSDSDMDTDGAPKNVRRSDFKNHLESDQSGDEDSVCSENSFIDDHKNKLNKKKEKSLSKNPFINAEVESDNKNVSKCQASGDEEEEDDDSDLSGFVVDDDEEITEEEDNSESASGNDDESLEEEDSENEDKEKDDIENLPEDMKKQFKELTEVGRSLYRSGQYEEAMAYILQALEIYPDTSLQVLALKLNKKISE